MSWQDDLGELDRALADGRIPADAYRRRRDEILAASSGAQPGPFPPPFRWTSPDTTSADATQVVHTTGWQPDPEPIHPPSMTWLVQGSDVFHTVRPGRGRIAAIVLAAIVLVGLIVGGLLLFGHEGRLVARPSPGRRPPDALAIAALPGDHGDTPRQDFLTPREIGFYREAGAGPCRLATSTTPDGVRVLVFTTVASSPAAAADARDSLAEQQLLDGMRQAAEPPPGVQVAEVDRTAIVPATIRAHYTHGATIVRIQVNGDDLTSVRAVFQDVIRAQVTVLAPGG